jgi:predicted transcriptional regulator
MATFAQEEAMGSKRPRRLDVDRLASKTLDERFLTEVQAGLNCSPFEAEAVLTVVREVYQPYLGMGASSGPPGSVSLVAVDADEPAGKPLAACQKRTISLLVHRGSEDDRMIQNGGASSFRRARIADLCQQALSQGALLTREDLAYRILFVSPRTISRDLQYLRTEQAQTPVPLRSMVQDIGPVLTHRVQIVQLALEGKTMSEICRRMHHSPAAVANYLSTFVRCAQLARKQMSVSQIAFLVHRSKSLVQSYLDLLTTVQNDPAMRYHLGELLRLGTPAKKKIRGRLR